MVLRIGADPEFVFKKDGKFVPANDPRIFGLDRERTMHQKIGTDGHAETAELRPDPQFNALGLTEEIRKMIKQCWFDIAGKNGFTAHAGSCGGEGAPKPLCGHIHFNIRRQDSIDKLIHYLDAPMLMLLFLEDYDENVIRRRQTSPMDGTFNGDLGSYRTKKYGTNSIQGFEYRTPSSWLVSPAITRGYFALYHSIVHDFQKGKLNQKHPLTKVKNFIDKYNINKKFRNAEHDAFKYKLKPVIRGIKELTMYKENYMNYQSYINTLFSLLKNGRTWNEDRDIFETWGVRTEIIEKALFYFRTKDYKIKDLIIPNLKLASTGGIFPIKVFGLNDKKTFNISTNNANILELITMFKMQNKDDTLAPELTNIYMDNNTELGIGRTLRDKKSDLVIELLKFIKQNYKYLTK